VNLPHLTIYTDNLPPNVGGTAQGFLVKIRPKYKDDIGIHNHEYQHVKQWYKAMAAWVVFSMLLVAGTYDNLDYSLAPLIFAGVGVHGFLYKFVRSYRLEAEAQAYAEQVKSGANLDDMAYRLVANDYYKLGITQEQAKVEIQRWITHD
jgi:hypothetical protein